MENKFNDKKILNDYSFKLQNKIFITAIKSEDINALVAFFNYSFQKKNNFFCSNFNKRNIKNIQLFYNKLKTNILDISINEIYKDISIEDLKTVRFLLINFINNKQKDSDIYNYLSTDNIKNNINEISSLLNILTR